MANHFDDPEGPMKLNKNKESWALLIYRDPPEAPWRAQATQQKRHYLHLNKAATECLLSPPDQMAQQRKPQPDARLSSKDRASIETLVVLELKAIAKEHQEHAGTVQRCIDWLIQLKDVPTGESSSQ